LSFPHPVPPSHLHCVFVHHDYIGKAFKTILTIPHLLAPFNNRGKQGEPPAASKPQKLRQHKPHALLNAGLTHVVVNRGTGFRYCLKIRYTFDDSGTDFRYLDLSG
jgi:hypothetical protein